jgi:hypothetical protein
MWWFVAQAMLEVGLVGRLSSSPSGGSVAFGEGSASMRSTLVLIHLLHPRPPLYGPVMRTRPSVQLG